MPSDTVECSGISKEGIKIRKKARCLCEPNLISKWEFRVNQVIARSKPWVTAIGDGDSYRDICFGDIARQTNRLFPRIVRGDLEGPW